MALQPAVLGTARLNAFRLGYMPADLAAIRRTSVRITLGGLEVRERVRQGSVTIRDGLNDTPNTCALVLEGAPPPDVADLRITVGTDQPTLLFSGTLQTTDLTYEGRPVQLCYPLRAIDDTARANRRRPFGKWTGVSATTIAKSIITTFAPGFTSQHVAPGLPPISVTFDGAEGFAGCLRQIAKLIGGYFYFEDLDLHLFQVETTSMPDPIDHTHPFLDEPAIRVSRDFSQLRTRVYGRGINAPLLSDITAIETLVPIADTVSFNPAGGLAILESQIVHYTGRQIGGAGSSIGPGAAPANAPTVAPASGAGIPDGPHSWAVSFVTASGESLVGPVGVLTVGALPAPTTAPVIAPPTIATAITAGPDPGSHDYAVSFVTAAGETPPGPTATRATGLTPEPTAAPVPGTPTVGAGPDPGYHDYAVSFVTAIGETLPGPISSAVPTAPLGPPASAPTLSGATSGSGPEAGPHGYAVTFVTATGETEPGPVATITTGVMPPPAPAPVGTTTPWPSNTPADYPGTRRYAVTFVTSAGETTPGPSVEVVPPVCPPPDHAMGLYVPGFPPGTGNLVNGKWYGYVVTFVDPTTGAETAVGPIAWGLAAADGLLNFTNVPYVGAYAASVYRTVGQAAPNPSGVLFYREQGPTFPVNLVQSGSVSDAVLVTKPQPSAPGYVPAVRTYALSAIPLGDATVTARKLYRTEVNGGQLKLMGTLADNTTTTYNDPFQVLGANAPTVNTVAFKRLALADIATGPTGVTQRRLYRTVVNGAALQFLAQLAGNNSTTYTDTTPDAGLGGAPPGVSTAAASQLPLTGIPTGDSNVSARRLYRRSGGAGFKLVAQLAGNNSTTYTDATPNAGLGAAPLGVSTAHLQKMALSQIPTGGPLVTARNVYRTAANAAALRLLTTIAGNGATTFVDTTPDSALGVPAPTGNSAAANQAALSSIPLGAAAVLSRKLYRTTAGGAQLKLLATLADNATTGYVDSSADAALGANAPLGDLSGLTQPTGQVLAGSTTLPVASAGAPFAPTGGWVLIGAQCVRYTGTSGNNLVGIPGPGLAGSLVNTVRYGEHADAAPVLMGVTGLTQAALKGIAVSIWVQRDDVVAQAEMIAIDAAQGRTTDGVYEYRIDDARRAEPSLIALCDADLKQFSRPIVTVVYATRDLKTKAGKPIVFDLVSPPIHGTLTIQDATITEIDIATNLAPRFTVTASSVRYSLDDLLRQMAAAAGV